MASKKRYDYFVLGGDVGGTNTNLAIAGIFNNKPDLLYTKHFESQKLKSLIPAIKEMLEYAYKELKVTVTTACIGGAGPVTNNLCKLTNLKWKIDAKEIIRKTRLNKVVVINDFQLIGYGINLLTNKDTIKIKKAKGINQTIAVIGAGTGLGKGILVYEDYIGLYLPIPSEGGHGDFPAQNEFELKLVNFVKKRNKLKQVSYEHLLSGSGIYNIYLFLNKGKSSVEIAKAEDKAAVISKYRKTDKVCRQVFELMTKYYGRCAKNFVLDSLATGGLYIGGGIALKNKEIFRSKEFVKEFLNCEKQSKILKGVPVHVIVNEHMSLHGACLAAAVDNIRPEKFYIPV